MKQAYIRFIIFALIQRGLVSNALGRVLWGACRAVLWAVSRLTHFLSSAPVSVSTGHFSPQLGDPRMLTLHLPCKTEPSHCLVSKGNLAPWHRTCLWVHAPIQLTLFAARTACLQHKLPLLSSCALNLPLSLLWTTAKVVFGWLHFRDFCSVSLDLPWCSVGFSCLKASSS